MSSSQNVSTNNSNKSFGSGFLKSLASTFKTSNSDRNKIDASLITPDQQKQELFNEVRTGSLSSRAKAVEQISNCLYEFETSSIPDIWYCARDLISSNIQHSVRKSGLILLNACVDLDTEDSASRFAYFNDAILNCHFTKDKIDPEFESFFPIIKKLTDDGKFIHHHQESFKKPLVQFFINALSASELAKNKSVLPLLNYMNDCIKSGLLDVADFQQADTKDAELLLHQIMKLCLKTSDKEILELCLYSIDTLVSHGLIPEALYYETLEILAGSATLSLNFYDICCEVTTNFINEVEFQKVFQTLINIIQSKNSKSEKNITASVGAIKLVGFTTLSYAYQINMKDLLDALKTVISWNRNSINVAVLQFINDRLLSDTALSQISFQYWDSDDVSILGLLQDLSKNINKNDEIELYKLTLVHLGSLAESSRYFGNTEKLVRFFIDNNKYLSTKISVYVLKYFSLENLCSPLHEEWIKNCTIILNTFYYDHSKDLTVRLTTLKLVKDVFDSSLQVFKKDEAVLMKLGDFLFKSLESEENSEIIKTLVDYLIEISTSLSPDIYQNLLDVFILPGFNNSRERKSSLASFTSSDKSDQKKLFNKETGKLVAKSMATIFAKSLKSDGTKASMTYEALIKIANFSLAKKDVDLLLIVSRFFVRIRASTDKQIYLSNPTDMDGLSAAFSRNLNIRKKKEPEMSALSLDESEKWTYPEEITYIAQEFLDIPSDDLTIFDSGSFKLSLRPTIDIEKWLSVVIQILETCPHWEIYSFIWAHFCPQLSNIKLFETCGEGIRKLRSLACDQLSLKLPSNLKLPENVSKHDLQVAIVRNFTPLISYHDLFSKQDEDQIIGALVVGLSGWEKTAIPCVHILTVCCYEIPLSIKKYLSVILTKLQTRISSAFASAHILEFLLSLSYIPSLTSNFTVDEFKRAFGITFKLIQYAHEISETKNEQHQGILNHGQELAAENSPSTENLEVTPTISIYLLTLSYDVIANWYLNMKMNDRRQLSSFIIKNLIISQSNRGTDISHQNMAFLDLISRFTYSDLELKFSPINPQTFSSDDPVLSSKWVYGSSIVGIDTHAQTGESIISIRRASGSTVFRVTPDVSMIPHFTNQLHAKEDPDDFTSNYMLLQLIVHTDPENTSKPIPIPEDPAITRSIANFDRIPVVEFHKIGLLYIGANQKTETEILSNSSGSLEYQKFLSQFGRLIKLKGCKSFYVGGLDTENDVDGEYAYGWNDKILQLIYHTTTLMPNQKDDPNFSAKKRHIGNNYVNIFFDESGLAFDFNVIKSQFNFLNIVIQPHSVSFCNDHKATENRIQKYKVKIHRRSGVPGLFATCHFKIVSEENLATFVRTLALIADQFAQIWHSNGNYASSWSHRMRQIGMIKDKAMKYHNEMKIKQNNDDSKSNEPSAKTGQSFLEQLSPSNNNSQVSRSNSISRPKVTNTNQYEYVDSEENQIFKNLEFTSFTK